MRSPDFRIETKGPFSKAFLDIKIHSFEGAMQFIKQLPYGRNENKKDLLTVFSDHRGTCGTKHAVLKALADEHSREEIRLVIGLFKMSGKNTPLVKATLDKYKLEYIPEAHNYLIYKGEKIDCTKEGWGVLGFADDVMEELDIAPDQITEYKVNYHKIFLEKWLYENPHISYTLLEIWEIREQCIRDLGN